MPKESVVRRGLVKKLVELGYHAHAVEAGESCPGFPDVEYCHPELGTGLLEIKNLDDYPKHKTTNIHLKKGYLKRAQVAFMRRRYKAGGVIGLALKIGTRDWFLIYPDVVLELYDRGQETLTINREWLENYALRLSGSRGLSAEALNVGMRIFHAYCRERPVKPGASLARPERQD